MARKNRRRRGRGKDTQKSTPAARAEKTASTIQKKRIAVLMDTSIIRTTSEAELISRRVADFVRQQASESDVHVRFLLPDLVVEERVFRMEEEAQRLLRSTRKIESLVGKSLEIGDVDLAEGVRAAVERQIAELSMERIQLDVTKVDWSQVVDDAVRRRAPFSEEPSQEKGFRDAIIGETCIQHAEAMEESEELLILVFEDRRLSDMVESRLQGRPSVQVVASLDELDGVLREIRQKVDRERIARLRDGAGKLFFDAVAKSGFYYDGKVRERVAREAIRSLSEIPRNADRRRNGTWYIAAPTFVERSGKRVHWSSKITVEAEALRSQTMGGEHGTFWGALGMEPLFIPGTGTPATGIEESNPFLGGGSWTQFGSPWPPKAPEFPSSIVVGKGKSIVHVIWSTKVDESESLDDPQIERIEVEGTEWSREGQMGQ